MGTINALGDSVNINLVGVDFYLDGGKYKSTKDLTLSGKDFYSNNGTFEVGYAMTLNFGDFINLSGTQINYNSSMTINLTGKFSNDSILNITGKKAYRSSVTIKGGDFYNGVDHSSAQEYFSGSIVLNNANLTIEKNLISEGVDKNNRSKIEIKDGTLELGSRGSYSIGGTYYNNMSYGTLNNGHYSDVFISGAGDIKANHLINQGNFYAQSDTSKYISFSGNIANKTGGQIHLKGVSLSASKSFTSEPGSKIYFSGITDKDALGVYGNIKATNINIKGASLYFSKGEALANAPYDFLIATSTLDYSSSLLGKKSVLSDDGSTNIFYEAVIEASDDGKKLKVTFEAKENVDIPDESEKNTIDIFGKENPIPGFDIKNLGINQIKTIFKNINDGLEHYSHSKDSALNSGFEAIKANVFARMIGGGSSSVGYQRRSDIIPYSPSNHYVLNTQNTSVSKSAPRTDVANANALIEMPKAQKPNNLYVNVLGAFQTSSEGYGYGYGLSVGYDRNFDDKMFIGAYLAYIGGGEKLDMLSSQTQGFEIGVYGRFETSILETDLILNQGYAYNKNTKNITILDSTYSTYSGYGTQSFDILLQSGPKFILGKNSIKPFIGINLNFYTGANVTEDAGAFASSYDFKDSVYLSESIGVEYKRAFKNGYLFVRPSYEANIYSNATETKVVFLNNTIFIAPPAKEMFGSVLLGGEITLNDFLLLNINASAKASNQKTFIATGMASLKYVF